MIQYINGDIFAGDDDVIIHGCNCMCTMNSGVAKQVRQYYPEAYQADQRTVVGDKLKLGGYSSCEVRHHFHPCKLVTVINAYTQYDYGYDNKLRFDCAAFELVLQKIKEQFGHLKIAMPKIGAGLAGGDWSIIEKIINKIFNDIIVKVYVV